MNDDNFPVGRFLNIDLDPIGIFLNGFLDSRQGVLRSRGGIAGVLGGVALYVSPLSVFAYLFFPVLDVHRHGQIRWRVMLTLAGTGLLTYTPLLVVSGREMLWGRRGILAINEARPLVFFEAMRNIVIYLFKHYTFLVFLLVPGLLGFRQFKALLVCSLAVFLPHLYVASSLPGENGVFLTIMDFFLSAWIAVGWKMLRQHRLWAWVPVALFVMHLAILLTSRTIFSFNFHPRYGEQLREFVNQHVADQDVLVLTDWDLTMTLTYFGRDAIEGGIEDDPLYTKMLDVSERETLPQSEATPTRGYIVVDPWLPGKIARLLGSGEQLAAGRQRYSMRVRAETLLGLHCDRIADVPHPSYRCWPADGPG